MLTVRLPSVGISTLQKVVATQRIIYRGVAHNDFGAPKKHATDQPVSPHVDIYKFPIPAVSSITFRATGAAATGGMVVLAIPMIFNPGAGLAFIACIKSWPIIHTLIKLFVAFPLVYHTIAGCRHLFWDYSSRGLENIDEVDKSSKLVLFTALIVSILISFVHFY